MVYDETILLFGVSTSKCTEDEVAPPHSTARRRGPAFSRDVLIIGMRAIAALGLVAIPLHYSVLKRLLAMVETVRSGDPFVAANAHRL